MDINEMRKIAEDRHGQWSIPLMLFVCAEIKIFLCLDLFDEKIELEENDFIVNEQAGWELKEVVK